MERGGFLEPSGAFPNLMSKSAASTALHRAFIVQSDVMRGENFW